MRKIVAMVLVISFLSFGLSGCIPIFLMSVGGVGVYAISKDTIQGDTDTPYETLWDAGMKVAKIRGTVLEEDFNRGYIAVDANPNKIIIQFLRVTTATTKVRVQARKYQRMFPNIDLAQDVFIKIIEESKQSTPSSK